MFARLRGGCWARIKYPCFFDRFCYVAASLSGYAPLAQLDRASDYESEGRAFESLRVRHSLVLVGLDPTIHFIKAMVPRLKAEDDKGDTAGGIVSIIVG